MVSKKRYRFPGHFGWLLKAEVLLLIHEILGGYCFVLPRRNVRHALTISTEEIRTSLFQIKQR